jgi:hypothetical protein
MAPAREKSMNWIGRIIDRFRGSREPAVPILEIDDERIRCLFPDGTVQQMAWDKLRAVIIETNDKGPFEEDVFFLLWSDSEEDFCAIPQSADSTQSLIAKLQCLPEFYNEAVIRAMGCTSNRSFLCWEKKDWIGENWPWIVEARNRREG